LSDLTHKSSKLKKEVNPSTIGQQVKRCMDNIVREVLHSTNSAAFHRSSICWRDYPAHS